MKRILEDASINNVTLPLPVITRHFDSAVQSPARDHYSPKEFHSLGTKT